MSFAFLIRVLLALILLVGIALLVNPAATVTKLVQVKDIFSQGNTKIKHYFSPLPSPSPSDLTSGNSRFSQGTCLQDSHCFVSGCSSEVCGNTASITTCEFSEDFPNIRGLNCGCVAGKCGWRAPATP